MSRIRSVHPGFFKDDRLVPCSPFARLLFIGLGVEADDKGVFEWKPVTLKMNIFPGDNIDMVALLEELVVAEAIRQYEIDGRKYGAIRNFRKFQKPKTPNDTHPASDEIRNYVGLSAANSETDAAEPEPFPQKVEKSFQMEDGGGKMEKEPPKPPRGGNRSKPKGAMIFLSKAVELETTDGRDGSQEGAGAYRGDARRIPGSAISDQRSDGGSLSPRRLELLDHGG